jgi:hypothetical protein
MSQLFFRKEQYIFLFQKLHVSIKSIYEFYALWWFRMKWGQIKIPPEDESTKETKNKRNKQLRQERMIRPSSTFIQYL